jgi:type II secretory pathway predicted ATPase ExeA
MYHEFYRLKGVPFQITPDPAFFFASTSHRAALDTLRAGIDTRQGVVAITGVSGVGKTTLVRAYLARVAPPSLTTIVCWQARLSCLEILTLMARQFEIQVTPEAPAARQRQIQACLSQEYHHGRTVVLIIDDAQHLPCETFEQVVGLMDLTPSGEPFLQLVLVGQPELRQHLRTWARAREGRFLHATIQPLTPAERAAYIRQRVARVALPGGPIFTPEALTTLVRHSNGVPRDVNHLCANVLQAGFQAQQQPITPALVRQVVAASTGVPPVPPGRRRLAAAGGLVLVAGLLWGAAVPPGPPIPRHHPAAPPPQSEAPPPSAPAMEALHWPAPAPQIPGASPSDRTVGHTPGEGDVRLAPVASLESPHLESPPALPTPRSTPRPPSTALTHSLPLPQGLRGITSLRPGATVGQKITVEGVLPDLGPESQVFLCVQSQAFGRRIYPQGKVVPDPTGQWTVPSIYATPGYRYATFLAHTTDPVAATLLSTSHARKYGLQDLPPGAERLGPAIVVLRE